MSNEDVLQFTHLFGWGFAALANWKLVNSSVSDAPAGVCSPALRLRSVLCVTGDWVHSYTYSWAPAELNCVLEEECIKAVRVN